MLLYLALAAVGLTLFRLGQRYASFKRNLRAAKMSGVPYICLPWYHYNTFWLVTHRLWLPFLNRLPSAWTKSWLRFEIPDWQWTYQLEPFRTLGDVDMFMIVTPSKNTMYVANPEAIAHITAHKTDFPKPIDIYKSLDIFGKNVVTTEGLLWRHHRKITGPPFTERNNRLVWIESLQQAGQMLRGWLPPGAKESRPVWDVAAQSMRLSLHVISRAGFGVHLTWPHESSNVDLPPGHKMTYKDAIEGLLDNIYLVLLMPRSILSRSPFRSHKFAYQSFVEWGQYMKDIYQSKRAEVKRGDVQGGGMDLMGALVKGAGITESSDKSDHGGKQLLTDDEILGNAFVFILAGHETAANTINFSLLFLAMHWESQQRLQKDLDDTFGDRPQDQWEYDEYVPKLFGNMCGAVMNEELRLIPPVIGIPKSTPSGRPSVLEVGGRTYTIPENSHVTLATSAVHRNPKSWPHTSLEDLEEFRPERWILDGKITSPTSSEPEDPADGGVDMDGPDKRPDTAPSLYRPPRGAYVPFSDGSRSCLGRRFAQVEILAVLATIFKRYSVELDVSLFMSDEELEAATPTQKRAAWDKALVRARDLLKNGMMTMITLQMSKGQVPLRFVERGHERFRFWRQESGVK